MLLLALACLTAESYPGRYAEAYCDLYERCDAQTFGAVFDDAGDCVAEWEATRGAYAECYDACEFVSSMAGSCLEQMADATCDDWEGGNYGGDCDEVYTCTEDQEEAAEACVVG
jgi:hypothetical protein